MPPIEGSPSDGYEFKCPCRIVIRSDTISGLNIKLKRHDQHHKEQTRLGEWA